MDKIERLHLKVAKCTKCNTIIDYKKFPVKSYGNFHSRNMIISEAPSRESIDNEKFWTGNSGVLLRECILDADMRLENDFYITDIVKCWPNKNKKNRKPNDIEIKNCSTFTTQEIAILKPANIFIFGKIPASLFIKSQFEMREINGTKKKLKNGEILYFFYHPSYILRQNDIKKELEYKETLTKMLKSTKII